MFFEWDNTKAKSNLKKHGVSFLEAKTVFGDPLAITFDDPFHSINEERLLTLGISIEGKYLIIAHTDIDDTLRIISAREMTKLERRTYENG